MKKISFQSTFAKMTTFFIGFGIIPVLVISMVFFYWYFADVEESTIANYTQIAEYAERNLSDVITQIDTTAGYMYDFSVNSYAHLYEVLEDTSIDPTEKKIYINKMLQDMLLSNERISSLRFYTPEGDAYVLFQSQGKSLLDAGKILNEVTIDDQNVHQRILMPAVSEADYCINTSDVVFSIVRSYMSTRSVRAIEQECLGTLYIDVSVKDIQSLLDNVEVGARGEIYILDPRQNTWLFSSDPEAYGSAAVAEILSNTAKEAVITHGQTWYFYQPMQNSSYAVVLKVNTGDVLDTFLKNRTFVILILGFSVLTLSIAYTVFSGKMSGPARKLKQAMKQLQTGDLKVQVDIQTHDEMEYLGEGFNKMVRDLEYYIQQVYMAGIAQKEAELNALKMQIQPHYLYNTLDVIRMTALENDDQKTARLLESLAKQFRYVIGQQHERVPLYMELNSIREYFILVNARYENKFVLNINTSDSDRNLYVLKLLLQPVVENCIKHGLRDKDGIGTIEINVGRFEDYLEILVMDDGIGMSAEQVQKLTAALNRDESAKSDEDGKISLGYKNVFDRIRLSCGEAYGFNVTSVEHVGTMVKFRLPIWEGDENVECSDRG